MSALAEIFLAKGCIVTGSDLRPNDLTERLLRKGARISAGHDAGNMIPPIDCVVRSSCIGDGNPELIKARELNVPVISRSEMLGRILGEARASVAVTGTHGKTTTAALAACIMEYCGNDPTVIIGGETDCFNGNAKLGRNDLIVSEVDESDGFFRNIAVRHAVVTNIEREHMEHYGSMENLVGAYRQFIGHIPPDGILVFNGEDRLLRDMSFSVSDRGVDFGLGGGFKCTCRNLTFARSIRFDFVMDGKDYGTVVSSLVGRHNVMNILGAMALCVKMGLDFDRVAEAVGRFQNVKRRFEPVGKIGTIEVIEDYAHHPTELRSVIKAAQDYGTGRTITVFQPHRYSRTNDLADGFLGCFSGSDILILTDVYSADEEPGQGTGVREIYEKIDKSGFELTDFMGKEHIPEFVSGIVRENDIVLVLGAGDIGEISGPLVRRIRMRGARVV